MNKNILLAAILFCSSLAASAQLEFGLGYMYSAPRGLMSYNIHGIHTFGMEAHYRLPNAPVTVGMDLGFGNYGLSQSDQLYEFPNATSMLAPVTVSNNVFNTSLVGRYEFTQETVLIPYAVARAGISRYTTRLTIEDPRSAHTSECPLPLETSKLVADVSWTTGLGAGLRYDMGHLFKGLGKGYYFLDFSASYTRGTGIDYMSVNTPSSSTGFNPNTDVQEVNLQFASEANPEIVHEYHSGFLYHTRLELIDYRIMFVYRLP
jgi:hypothetical protein